MIFYIIGIILEIEALFILLSMLVALYYKEPVSDYLITAGLMLAAGGISTVKKPKDSQIYAREGFVIVGLTWIVMSLFGALPFFLSGEIPNYIDALFETISGFTTTGATILTDVESMPRGLLFWRSFTHLIGGMGVLVFVLAVVPLGGSRSMHLMRAEVAGPTVGKIVPKMGDTAKILYALYLALTTIETAFLIFGGMPLYDSVIHAMGTAGTGGFGIMNNSIAGYDSAYIEWVITIFMLLFSINFNLYYIMLIGKIRQAFASEELRCFFLIVAASVAVIAGNIRPMYESTAKAVRLAAFQVASIMSTTGYSTCDFDLWPELSKSILIVLMFIGGCAGSTSGGIKLSRVLILIKSVKNEMAKMLHPQYVNTVRAEGKPLDANVTKNACMYGVAYMIIMVVSFLLISIDEFDFETTMTAVFATLNDVGPGFHKVGPSGNFSMFSGFSKTVLMCDMLIGRLEIFPVLMILAPSTWISQKSYRKFFRRGENKEKGFEDSSLH